jgi:hypothetical protein
MPELLPQELCAERRFVWGFSVVATVSRSLYFLTPLPFVFLSFGVRSLQSVVSVPGVRPGKKPWSGQLIGVNSNRLTRAYSNPLEVAVEGVRFACDIVGAIQ